MYFIMNNNSILLQKIKKKNKLWCIEIPLREATLPFSFTSFVNYVNSCWKEFAPLREEMSLDRVG